MTTARIRLLALMTALALSAPAAGASVARAFPKEVMAWVEARPDRLMSAAQEWGIDRKSVLDGPLTTLADSLGLTLEELRPEIGNVKSAAAAVVRIDAKTEKLVWLAAIDLSDAPNLRVSAEMKLNRLPKKLAVGNETACALGGDGPFAVISGTTLVVASDMSELAGALARLGGTGEGLDKSDWYKASSRAPALQATADVAAVYRWLSKAERKNDDFAALDVLFDLKTIERVELSVSEDAHRIEASARLNGGNRTCEAMRMKLAPSDMVRYFSVDWGCVAFGAPVDGGAQAKALTAILKRFCDIDGDRRLLEGPAQIEKLLGVRLDEEAAGLVECAAGIRADAGGRIGEWLLAAKLKDPARAELLARNANLLREEGAWAASTDGATLLLGSSDDVIAAARETLKSGKCVLDERTARQALAMPDGTPAPQGVILINPLGFLPKMPRNPYAPPPSLAALAIRQDDRKVSVTADIAQMKGIVRVMQRLFGRR